MSSPIGIPPRKTPQRSYLDDELIAESPQSLSPFARFDKAGRLQKLEPRHLLATLPFKSSSRSRTMDEFAQSREDDDLFADEFEPVADSTPVFEEPKTAQPPAQQEPTFKNPPPQVQSNHNNNRREQGHRGRGRGRGGNNGLNSSRYASQPEVQAPQIASEPITTPDTTTPQSSAPAPPPTAPESPVQTRTPAVRGDRSATGGPTHKKLTEEELSAKMAAMAILNAEKSERHKMAEADQAAYQHREKELAKERKEKAVAERKNERVMEMERAKNRERKMKAQQGREWDSEKVEADIVDRKGRSSEYVRGGYGGVMGGGLGGSRYSTREDEEEVDSGGRGRGGFVARGRSGGRGGRGGRGGKAPTPTVPTAEDFPSLPTAAMSSTEVKTEEINSKTEAIKSPTGEKGPHDWAEEMATPIEEKKEAI